MMGYIAGSVTFGCTVCLAVHFVDYGVNNHVQAELGHRCKMP